MFFYIDGKYTHVSDLIWLDAYTHLFIVSIYILFYLISTVAHLIYGIPNTINCANYAYFLALDRVIKLGKPEATAAFTGN